MDVLLDNLELLVKRFGTEDVVFIIKTQLSKLNQDGLTASQKKRVDALIQHSATIH